jgi:hypothetical protein
MERRGGREKRKKEVEGKQGHQLQKEETKKRRIDGLEKGQHAAFALRKEEDRTKSSELLRQIQRTGERRKDGSRRKRTRSIPSKTKTLPFFAALTAPESTYSNLPPFLNSLACFNSFSLTSRWRETIS